jgi:hypothetical protein
MFDPHRETLDVLLDRVARLTPAEVADLERRALEDG